jgi:hypothetical protein
MIKIDLIFRFPTLDYLWPSFMKNSLFYTHIMLEPISEVRTQNQATTQTIYVC